MRYIYDDESDIIMLSNENKKEGHGYPFGPIIVLEDENLSISTIECMWASKVFNVSKQHLIKPNKFVATISVGDRIKVKLVLIDKEGNKHYSEEFSEDAAEIKIKKGDYELVYELNKK